MAKLFYLWHRITTIFRMTKRLCLLTLSIIWTLSISAQISSDSWRDHMSYRNGKSLAVSKSRVYCATDMSMFYYDKDDNSINHLTPIEGLSDIGIDNIAYCDKLNTLVIGYSNGNIDLLPENGKIFNLSGLKDKNMATDKAINHIDIVDDMAYLSSNFGLVTINIERKEFHDTYILGSSGRYMKINCSAIYDGYLYAFTNSGLMRGQTSNPFLTDIKNWSFVDEFGTSHKLNTGCVFNGKLFVSCFHDDGESCSIHSFDGEKWKMVWDSVSAVKSMTSRDGKLVLTTHEGIDAYDENLNSVKQWRSNSIGMGIADGDIVWYTHSSYGLSKFADGNPQGITPSGPDRNAFFQLCYNAGVLLVAPGGMTEKGANIYRRADVLSYDGENWSSIDQNVFPDINSCYDIVNFATCGQKDHYIINPWRCGIVEYDNGTYTRFTSSSTDSILGDMVSYCTFDRNGNLWCACSITNKPIAVRATDGKWYSYAYGNYFVDEFTNKLICTRNNDLWLTAIGGKGMLVLNASNTPEIRSDDSYKFITPTDKNGAQLNSNIHDIAEDKNGTIWIASDEGVYVYDHPEYILEGEPFYARYPQMVEDGFYQSLLATEIVNTIAIDDANRKWFGTANGGIFVISPDGTKQYAVYNKTNSPLFSNNVTSLAIDNDNGILYIITDKGLQSVRISSSKPEIDLSEIYAFPNPVEPDYYGDVTIRGLMSETVVKITDLYGNLVFETMSNGGSAVWNVCNMDGKRVETGIYLIQCITSDGQSKGVGKIHVIK